MTNGFRCYVLIPREYLADQLAILTMMADGHFPQLEGEVPGAALFLREWDKQ